MRHRRFLKALRCLLVACLAGSEPHAFAGSSAARDTTYTYIYIWCSVAQPHPPPPHLVMVSPPPLWCCGGGGGAGGGDTSGWSMVLAVLKPPCLVNLNPD